MQPEGSDSMLPEAPKHAPSEVRGRGFLIFLIGLVFFGFAVHLTVYYSYRAIRAGLGLKPASPLQLQLPVPPDPQQEGSAVHPNLPWTDLAELHARERERLTSYGWADRAAGAVHIPIERAKKLVLERGLAPRGASSSNQGE
ncbi:MAG TPA: hypothetical protein P5572_11195 [Phycisphaerae bacterium]|nr:hypothetical protein [Phycisphaerae bacterium]